MAERGPLIRELRYTGDDTMEYVWQRGRGYYKLSVGTASTLAWGPRDYIALDDSEGRIRRATLTDELLLDLLAVLTYMKNQRGL